MISIIIRTVILYVALTVSIRLMGKRQIGDMQPNELVVTLLISEIAAIPLQDTAQPILNGIVSIFILVILEIILSVITMKSLSVRRLMSGQSIVVIKNGKIDQSAMSKVRMTVLDLVELLRAQGIFRIEEVAYAILEVNGELSVMKTSEAETPTCKDLNICNPPVSMPLPVIIDGRIIKETLQALSLSKKELYDMLNKQRLNADEIFLMTVDRNGKAFTVKRSETL